MAEGGCELLVLICCVCEELSCAREGVCVGPVCADMGNGVRWSRPQGQARGG